jgi:5-carboxymethyl-2-hydroxymuconate isomerase
MPLVKTHLRSGRTAEDKRAIGDAIQAALIEAFEISNDDLYQLFTEYSEDNFRHTDGYLGLTYTDQLIVIELSFIEGRSDEMKKALHRRMNEKLVATGLVRSDDVFVRVCQI